MPARLLRGATDVEPAPSILRQRIAYAPALLSGSVRYDASSSLPIERCIIPSLGIVRGIRQQAGILNNLRSYALGWLRRPAFSRLLAVRDMSVPSARPGLANESFLEIQPQERESARVVRSASGSSAACLHRGDYYTDFLRPLFFRLFRQHRMLAPFYPR